MTDKVSVRISVQGGSQFKTEMQQAGREGARAMQQIGAASQRVGPQIQNAAFQIGDFAVQVAGGTSAFRAAAQQLPQLLGGFGVAGAVFGAAAAGAAALIPVLFGTGDAAGEAAEKLVDLEGSIGKVDSATAAVRETQKAYNEAIAATGGASSAAAAVVVASSKAEFQARKEVLAIELELLRIRGQERGEALQNLQAGIKQRADGIFGTGIVNTFDPGLGSDAVFAPDPNRAAREAERAAFSKAIERDSLAARKLRLEIEATNKAVESGNKLLTSEFETVASGASLKTKGGKGGGGGAEQNAVLKEAEKVFEATRTAAEKYAMELDKLNALYKAGVIDTQTYDRAVVLLNDKFAQSGELMKSIAGSVKSGLGSLFDTVVEGGKGAGEALEGLAKKLASLALQNSAFQLLAGLAPGIFGAGGTIPLVPSAMGNVFSGGNLVPFASGGIVSKPTLFAMKSGAGLMGEAGPEGILPLSRIGGKLGVNAAGIGGGTSVQVINMGGGQARVERGTGPDGREIVKVIVGEELARGGFDRELGRYGSRATQVRR